MEAIANLGRGVDEVVGPTYAAYGRLLSTVATQIHSTKVTTYSYGSKQRQKLDLYEPASNIPSPDGYGRERPVLVYVYGGAFMVGDRIVAEIPGKLVYANIGSFFADQLGYNVVIMDYHLVKHGAKYPSGGEDLSLAISWVGRHFSGRRNLFLMGNSAGGLNVATWLFDPVFQDSTAPFLDGSASLRLRGVIFLSTPLSITPEQESIFEAYYGDKTVSRATQPAALVTKLMANQNAVTETLGRWPAFLVLVAELDPESLGEAAIDFARRWREVGGRPVDVKVLAGHNHISPPLSLGTGVEGEEAWGHMAGVWMTAKASEEP